jgi:hypothetical protein
MDLYSQDDFEKLCKDTEQRKKQLQEEEIEINKILNKCTQIKYKYGTSALKLIQLIDLIQKENIQDVDVFLDLFPPTGIKNVIITRSHVFEALWIIIFILKLDDLIDISKEKRVLYKSLEKGGISVDYINHLASTFFEKNNVNASRSGGIVDIYFEQFNINDAPEMNDELFACEGGCYINTSPDSKRKKFLYSSKFYLKEKGVGSYDIDKIFTEAIHKINEHSDNYKIGVLVNNKSELFDKCKRSVKVAANILNRDISYDTSDLNILYKRLLVFLKKHKNNVDSIVERHLELEPRFHQQYFINYTNSQIDKKKFKYIWGAVPRSGKSYMIGGLVALRQPHNVLIILGAVSETNQQFYKMFEKFKGSFGTYNIVNISDEKDITNKYAKIEPAKKNIVIISQQQLWQRQKTTGAHKVVDKIKQLLSVDDKMVFFDEIHQGAGEDSNAQVTFLNEYIFEDINLNFPFIMVTATFSKPILKYKTFGNAEPLLVQWTYDMIQNMKDIANSETLEYMQKELLNELDGELKNKHFSTLLDEYVKKGKTLYDLQHEYVLYPELCVICPDLNTPEIEFNEIRELNENVHTDLNIRDIFDVKKIQKGATKPIQELLKYIEKIVFENFLLNVHGFDVLNKQHTQLWFLPTHLTGTSASKPEDSEEDKGIIEPLMRYLMLELLKNDFFRDNFCFIILHGKNITKLDEKKYADIKKLYNGTIQDVHKLEFPNSLKDMHNNLCFSTKCLKGSDDKECIRQEECKAYKLNKSLIILTGQKMRVGVSLPCVDIALHMDPITSVDVIYQSMFRVLTERNGKNRAYFIDILKTRFIKFLYEYESNVNFGKKPSSLTERFNKAHQLLYSFNLNGINLQDNTKEYLNIYKSLVDALGLNSEYSFNQKTIEFRQNEDNSKSVINLIGDNAVDELYKIIQKQTFDKIKQAIKTKLLTRKGIIQATTITQQADTADTADTADKDVPELSDVTITQEQKRKDIQEYLLNLLTLYILFNDNSEDKCTDMKEIEKGFNILNAELPYISSNYERIHDFIKDVCENEMGNIIDCYYLKSLHIEDKEDKLDVPVAELINGVIKMLQNNRKVFTIIIENIQHNEISKNEFFKLYCNIKDSILMVKEYSKQNKANIVKYDETETDKLSPDCSATFIINEKILKIIREHLTVRKDEKEKNGEVFTPPELICEMLDKLPKPVWKDPLLKWLDPANGIGNFPIIAYYKLMEGLKDVAGYEDEDVRSKHIIEEMLFMIEINKVNVEVCKKIFKMIDGNAEPNIVCADFLKEDSKWKKDFFDKKGVDNFDIIFGNPPYNEKGTKTTGKKNIYVFFATKGLALLNKDGYLAFIHPSAYRVPNHKIQQTNTDLNEIYTNKHIICIKMFTVAAVNRLMHIMMTIDYIIVQNTPNNLTDKSTIIDVNNNQYSRVIQPNDFIPNYGVNILDKLKQIATINGNVVIEHSHIFDTRRIGAGKFKNVHGIIAKGIKICMSNEKNKYSDIRKLIFNGLGSYNYVYYDKDGKYGITQSPFFILEPTQNTLNLIQSKLFHYIADATKIIGNNFNIQTSLFLPLIDNKEKINNEQELYAYFGLTKEEIAEIENNAFIPNYPMIEIACNERLIKASNNEENDETIVDEQEVIPVIVAPAVSSNSETSETAVVIKTPKKKRKLILVDGGANKSINKHAGTLKKNYKYKPLHNKSITKK